MNGWQVLLFPFAIIYDLVTRCRNWLYDVGVFRSQAFSGVSIISVGNLAVGGTGKTPMVEYLIRTGLQMNVQMAVLSRGYGRNTKGVRIAKKGDTAAELGDESFGYFEQFGDRIKVVVAEKRVQGVAAIQAHFPEVKVVLLDDAYQHRAVSRELNILLTNFNKPYWKDYLLPAGRLREARSGAKRADICVFTKVSDNQIDEAIKLVIEFTGEGVIAAATSVAYGEMVLLNGSPTKRVIAIAGLADNRPFFDFVKEQFDVLALHSFPDHKEYTENDLEPILQAAKEQSAMLVTTFKDGVKLKEVDAMKAVPWGYVPIRTVFVAGEGAFLKKVTAFLNAPSESADQR